MREKSLKLNSFMNTFKTLMTIIFPLITYPYALRVLGVSNIGKANFANSIVSYFVLIAGLGISRYAIREGARKRDDKNEFSDFAGQMLAISLVSTVLAYVLLGITLLISPNLHPYIKLIMIYSVSIVGTTFGMDWVNSAYEEYVYITLRSILFQFISMILLFCFVKNESDLIWYVWISVISNIGANILNFFYIRKYTKVHFKFRGCLKHLSPILWLFASSIATTIYVNSDTTMLGLFCNDYTVGLYSVATKVYSILKQLLAASILVTLPRLSNYWAHDRVDEFKKTISGVFTTFSTILFPAVIGVFLLSPEIIQLIGGNEYFEGSNALRILSISLIFSIFGTFYTNTMLLPMKKERQVTIIMFISAGANVLLNLVLIPLLKQDGAALTTVIAEAIVMLVQMAIVRKKHVFDIDLRVLIQIGAGCTAIAIIVLSIKSFALSLIWTLALSVGCSAVAYFLVLLVLKNTFVCVITGQMSKILKRIKNKRV